MEKPKIFCVKCGIRLYSKTLLNKGSEMYEFKEGMFCGKCGKIKVDEARKK